MLSFMCSISAILNELTYRVEIAAIVAGISLVVIIILMIIIWKEK